MTTATSPPFHACQIKTLPPDLLAPAARTAIGHNSANRPTGYSLFGPLATALLAAPGPRHPDFLALITTKYWGTQGRKLGVSFLEQTNLPLRDKLLAHMNAWNRVCNIQFAWSQSQGEVRISRDRGGYWSYLGTDILHVPAGQQTMNLEGFTLRTPDDEYTRVVRHETGHTLGFPHEHLRRQIVARLDAPKTIRYFQQTQGWSAQMVQQQVLTPLEDSVLQETPQAETDSIMCYQLPAEITTDGQPIPGGMDINADDAQFAAQLYPLAVAPPPPQPPGPGSPAVLPAQLVALDNQGRELGRYRP